MNLLNSDFSANNQNSASNQQQQQQQQMQPMQQNMQHNMQPMQQNRSPMQGYATPDYPEFIDPAPNQQQQQQQVLHQAPSVPNLQSQPMHNMAMSQYPQSSVTFGQDVVMGGGVVNTQLTSNPLTQRGESRPPRESRMSSVATAARKRKQKDAKTINDSYKKAGGKRKQSLEQFTRRLQAVSELGGASDVGGHSQADRLVSGISQLQINTKRRGRKPRGLDGGIQSQPCHEREPARKNPHRAVKRTDKGQLAPVTLYKRTTGVKEVSNRDKSKKKAANAAADVGMQVDEQQQVPAKVNSDEIDPADPYEKIRIDQNKDNDEIVCDVCLDDDDDDNNEIVICDLCLGAVHQSCYGSELLGSIPEGNWYCARCRDLLTNQQKKCTEIKCVFCPKIDGILKPITGQNGKQDMWAHPICVNWLQGVWYKDDRQEQLEGQISSQHLSIPCSSCRGIKHGAVIQCEYQNCHSSSHVRCAAQKGWIYHWNEMMTDLDINRDDQHKPVFCTAHKNKGILTYKIRGMEGLKAKGKKPTTQQAAPLIQIDSPNALNQIKQAVEGQVPKNKKSQRIQKKPKVAKNSRKKRVVNQVRRESNIANQRTNKKQAVNLIANKKQVMRQNLRNQNKAKSNKVVAVNPKKKAAASAGVHSKNKKAKQSAKKDNAGGANDAQSMSQMLQMSQLWNQMQQMSQMMVQTQQQSAKPAQQPMIQPSSSVNLGPASMQQQSNRSKSKRNKADKKKAKMVKTQQSTSGSTTPPLQQQNSVNYMQQQPSQHAQYQQQMPQQNYGHQMPHHQQQVQLPQQQSPFAGQMPNQQYGTHIATDTAVGTGKPFNFQQQQWA